MKKQEFLAMSLPYGLKVHRIRVKKDFWEFTGERFSSEFHFRDSTYIPIVRPLSDLVKECVQADYNDGEPFVPIVELAKIASGISFKNYELSDIFEITTVFGCIKNFIFGINKNLDFYLKTSGLKELRETNIMISNQFRLLQQLISWHFDLTTEECEKVYVTDEFNPYK